MCEVQVLRDVRSRPAKEACQCRANLPITLLTIISGKGDLPNATERKFYIRGEFISTPEQLRSLAVSPVVALDGAQVEVKLSSKMLKAFDLISFEPLATKKFAIPVQDVGAAKKLLDVTIQNAAGRTLLHWFAGTPVDGNPDLPVKSGIHKTNQEPGRELPIEELFLRGVNGEKEGRPLEATKIYDKVLKRDSGYVPALLKLAEQQCLAADFASAAGLIV